MTDIWFIADLHLGHVGLIEGFKRDGVVTPGGRAGPRGNLFATIEEHDETIITNWNRVVKPQDKVYVLGDLALSKRGLQKAALLQGHKRLVFGNHDQGEPRDYVEVGFKKLSGAKCLEGMVLTHIPVHPAELMTPRPHMQVNLHGHLHEKVVMHTYSETGMTLDGYPMTPHQRTIPDPRYQSVSCEQVGFTPIHLDAVKAKFGSNLKAVA